MQHRIAIPSVFPCCCRHSKHLRVARRYSRGRKEKIRGRVHGMLNRTVACPLRNGQPTAQSLVLCNRIDGMYFEHCSFVAYTALLNPDTSLTKRKETEHLWATSHATKRKANMDIAREATQRGGAVFHPLVRLMQTTGRPLPQRRASPTGQAMDHTRGATSSASPQRQCTPSFPPPGDSISVHRTEMISLVGEAQQVL